MSRKASLTSDISMATASSSVGELRTRNVPYASTDTLSTTSSKSSVVISEEGLRLQKHLGLMNGVGIVVGIIVGGGIFVSPKGVMLAAGSVGGALIVWSLCGMICLIGAMCYAELGTAVLRSGADYAYISEAYGDFPSFLYLWVAVVIVLPTGNAITALTFATYVLQAIFPRDCPPPHFAIRVVAAMCLTEVRRQALRQQQKGAAKRKPFRSLW